MNRASRRQTTGLRAPSGAFELILRCHTRSPGVARARTGRIGAIVGAFVGAVALSYGASAYYQMLTVAMTGCFLALLIVGRHVPRSRDQQAATP